MQISEIDKLVNMSQIHKRPREWWGWWLRLSLELTELQPDKALYFLLSCLFSASITFTVYFGQREFLTATHLSTNIRIMRPLLLLVRLINFHCFPVIKKKREARLFLLQSIVFLAKVALNDR